MNGGPDCADRHGIAATSGLNRGRCFFGCAIRRGQGRGASGDLKLVDVGTVFEVLATAHETRVFVSEGAVMADPDGARLKLGAGQRLDTEDGAGVLEGDRRRTYRRSARSNAAS